MLKRLLAPSEARDVILVLAVTLLLWEGGVWLFQPAPLILPAPSAIAVAFWETPQLFMRHLGFTILTTMAGFVSAVVFGVLLAVGMIATVLARSDEDERAALATRGRAIFARAFRPAASSDAR